MTPHFWPKNDKNARGAGVLPEKLDGNVWYIFLKPLPYFRPKSVIFPTLFQTFSKIWYPISALEPSAWLERVTSTYMVVGVNIKREMVLSPNNEEVANSSKKHTQFKTRVHKPYPISDQNVRNWYPISDQNGWKKHALWHRTYPYSLYKGLLPGAKNALQIMSLAAYAARLIST